jgi:hypothetical protein
MFLVDFICPDCGSTVAFYSRRRTFTEKYLLPLLLLRPFRCADCFRRSYGPVFVQAQVPRTPSNAKGPAGTHDDGHVRRVA